MDKRKLLYRTIPITIAAIIAVYITANYIRKKIIYAKILDEGSRPEKYNPKELTITNEEAATRADNLEKAFKPFALGLGWGTDEQAIIDNLTGLTASDILLIEQKFGTRDGKNLRTYIKSELGEKSKDFARVRSIYQAVGLNL